MKALPVLTFIAGTVAVCSLALAHCRVADLKLEQAISQDSKLRQSANAQVVRDLRTLRDAAVVLAAYEHESACKRVVAVLTSNTKSH